MSDKYNENDKDSILEYAKKLEGKKLRDILDSDTIKKILEDESGNKGKFGQKIERYFFEYECNSDTKPDFPCGLELKATPLKVNKDGSELMFDLPPKREPNFYEFWQKQEPIDMVSYNILPQGIEVPKGTIEKLIGKKLTWEDEPVELKEGN